MNMIEEAHVKSLLDSMAEVRIQIDELVDNDLDRLDKREDFRIQELLLKFGRYFYEISKYEKLEDLIK